MVCIVCHESQFTAPSQSVSHPVALQCGHVFHKPCIEGWFRSSDGPSCPLCHKPHTASFLTLYVDEANSASNGSTSSRPTAQGRAAPVHDDMDDMYARMAQMSMAGDDSLMHMALQGNMYMLQDEMEELTEEKDMLEERVQDLESDVACAKSRADALQMEVNRLAKISHAHKTHIRSLQQNLEEKKQQLRYYGVY
ncbi:hypothetical protein IW139_004058 [Coemansia sp. RSA 353]|nr:hypothetical protein IW142_003743 [Coemansia sp. RSA 564]KAJ2221854.1 hypothetical protein EV180_004513 [Coemansia sp. RSA 518]KAJ2224365.1 RING finger and transmembrane domain-containing protein 2 [Coemansia sp. RSA 520]KAJ2295025.1 hypothetical protein IW139_004058 [Coemansia sp. RSA 353]